MASATDVDGINLYRALMRKDKEKVIDLCRKVPEGASHVITIHNDTVLHMAAYSNQEHLLLKLLEDQYVNKQDNKMTHQNDNGNTFLHEAAVTIQNSYVADKMMNMITPELLQELLVMQNKLGETAHFLAAHYGNTVMFNILAGKISEPIEENIRRFLQRDDKTTVLHISIIAENFELAWKIANEDRYQFLISDRDNDGLTGLQLLSSNSSVFKSRSQDACFNQLVNPVKSWCRKQFQKGKHWYALELARCLIEKDTSWEATKPGRNLSKPTHHNYGAYPKASFLEKGSGEGSSTGSLGQRKGKGKLCSSNANEDSFRDSGGEGHCTGSFSQKKRGGEVPQISNETSCTEKINGEIPLFLATRSGCVKIVKEILHQYPQAVEYVNDQGENILHLAIKYRQLKIFKLVKKMKVPMQRLVQHVDINGSSILHMVGSRMEDNEFEDIQGPDIKLKEELQWFERVKKVTRPHFISHRNLENQTADDLFASTNRKLHNSAKQWITRTAEGFSVVAVLIASVTFAAAYTIPGGPDQRTGFPLLLSEPFFLVFIVSDIASFAFALMMLLTYLLILKSSLQIEDFRSSLPLKITIGFKIFCFSVTFMMIAFAATVVLMIQHRKSWGQLIVYGIPVGFFSLIFFPLYLLVSSPKYLCKKTKQVFPVFSQQKPSWIHDVQNRIKITYSFKNTNRNPSNPHQSQSGRPTSSTTPASPKASIIPV